MNWKFEDGRITGTDENSQLMAEATFPLKKNGEVDINHTFVNPALRGQGVAGKMMEVVAEYLRQKGLKATASCPFANVWLKRNREVYADILSKDFDEDTSASKTDGKR